MDETVSIERSPRVSGIVNQDGVVHQKDLGPKTAQPAIAMKTDNPDRTWAEAEGASTKR